MKLLIAIQVMVESGGWGDAAPIIHELENEQEAALIMKAIAKQFDLPIRVTYPNKNVIEECKSEKEIEDYISRLNGHYPHYDRPKKEILELEEEDLEGEEGLFI